MLLARLITVAIGIVYIQQTVSVGEVEGQSSGPGADSNDADSAHRLRNAEYEDDTQASSCVVDAITSTSSAAAAAYNQPPQQPIESASRVQGGKVDDNDEWNWDPTSTTHPCTILRISRSELHRLYGPGGLPNLEYPFPIIIHPDDDEYENNEQQRPYYSICNNTKFANLTTHSNLPTNFPPNFQVTLSGSDSLSSHRRTVPLRQYLTEILNANNGSGTTLPTQLGNETWYFFGETHSSIWSSFLRENYALPPCRSCTRRRRPDGVVRRERYPHHQQREKIAVSFGIGNVGSGVQWHIHGPGFSETIHGRKHWVLYPPDKEPFYDLHFASRHWMENTYPTLEDWTEKDIQYEKKKHEEFWQRWQNARQQRMEEEGEWGHYFSSGHMSSGPDTVEPGPSKRKPWECTVHEGEIIYFPNLWHHATINLEKYTVFVSSFT